MSLYIFKHAKDDEFWTGFQLGDKVEFHGGTFYPEPEKNSGEDDFWPLYGRLNTLGDDFYPLYNDDVIWAVLETDGLTDVLIKCEDMIENNEYIYKFKYCWLRSRGDYDTVTRYLYKELSESVPIAGIRLSGGREAVLRGGNYSKLICGDWGRLMGGKDSVLKGGTGTVFSAGKNSKFIGLHGKDDVTYDVDDEDVGVKFKFLRGTFNRIPPVDRENKHFFELY